MEERCSGIGATVPEQLDGKQQLRFDIDRSVDPVQLTADFDGDLVDDDTPRRR
jgi:hypothetical protein